MSFVNQIQKPNEPFDILKLPTGGILYPSKVSSLEITHMRARDEDIISSPSLKSENKVWETLYNMKVKNADALPYSSLYSVDKLAFMLHIRVNAYGNLYECQVPDIYDSGFTNIHTVDLSQIDFTEFKEFPDDKGLFNFTFPRTNTTIKYRFLTTEEENNIEEKVNKYNSQFTNPKLHLSLTIEKLKQQVVELNGSPDVKKIIEHFDSFDFKPSDIVSFNKHKSNIFPYIDLSYEFTSKKDKKTFKYLIPITGSFFFPSQWV
jgi:hypothetical protein